jgi:hypothetical protein
MEDQNRNEIFKMQAFTKLFLAEILVTKMIGNLKSRRFVVKKFEDCAQKQYVKL